MEVGVLADLAEQQRKNGVRLGLGHADDTPREACMRVSVRSLCTF
jgi:hypothetical protein